MGFLKSRSGWQKLIAIILVFAISIALVPQSSISVEAASSAALEKLQKNLEALQKQQQDIKTKIDSLATDQKNAEAKLGEYQGAMENVQAQIDVYQQQVDALNAQIANYNAQINEKNAQIDQKNLEIETKNAEIAQKQADLDQSYADFKSRFAAMYRASSSSSSMGVLFGAESFSDFLTQAKALQNISERDNEIMDQLMAQKQELESLKTQLEQDKAAIEAVKVEIEGVKAQIEAQKADIVAVQAQEQTKRNELDSLRAEAQSVVNTLESQQHKLDEQDAALDLQREKAIAAIIAEQERIRKEQEAAGNKKPIDAGSGWLWPCPTYSFVSQYYSDSHKALDVASGAGNPIVASRGGSVVFAGFGSAANGFNRYGNVVLLDHGDGYYTLYAHASALYVSNGQTVSQGQKIAAVGNTGQSFGNHLHFEVRNGVQGTRLNPSGFVSKP